MGAKLTVQDVGMIREMQGKIPAKFVARQYKVGVEAVRKIWRGETWTDWTTPGGRDWDGEARVIGERLVAQGLASSGGGMGVGGEPVLAPVSAVPVVPSAPPAMPAPRTLGSTLTEEEKERLARFGFGVGE